MKTILILDEPCNFTNISLTMQRLSKFEQKQDSVSFNYSNENLKTFIIQILLVKILKKRLLILLTRKQ